MYIYGPYKRGRLGNNTMKTIFLSISLITAGAFAYTVGSEKEWTMQKRGYVATGESCSDLYRIRPAVYLKEPEIRVNGISIAGFKNANSEEVDSFEDLVYYARKMSEENL